MTCYFCPLLLDLLDAFEKNDRSLVLNLLCKSNINFERPIDKHGNTFLHSAAKSVHARMVEMLISYSSVPLDVNSKNLIGVTPLHVAALNNTEACSMLLKYNADVNSTSNLGYTPLQYAAKHGQLKACRWLYTLESTNFKGRPVHYTNEELNINWQNCYEETALHLVIDARDGAIMKSKKKWPFNICEDHYTEIVKLLFKIGADTNIKNHSGDTPLHSAVRCEMEYIVILLLHFNAHVDLRNDKNETPLDLTKSHSYPHVKDLLKLNNFYSKGDFGNNILAIIEKQMCFDVIHKNSFLLIFYIDLL